jgi:hypothetical protein
MLAGVCFFPQTAKMFTDAFQKVANQR